ncbi:MAG: sugar ABC transporter ATP-binding protein [Acidiferrobacteraceae bacterium]|jgi:multiple sugar transport system ATP-binding protein|nr:sugar ABC transporter ATP-binding protein [Acidiferrobacteraceae bacterium]
MGSISINRLSKQFGAAKVLNDIELEIQDGEFLVLVGPSGCGKSTLINLIAGLLKQSEGAICIDETDVSDVSPGDRDIAMVFQSYALYPTMNVSQNLSFGLEMKKTPKDEIKQKVEDVSSLLKIDHLLDRKPSQLSGGQRQRVAMGRALARSPKIFLFDEPLSNLDAKLRVEMRTEIKKLHQRLGTTIVYVTHDQVEAMTLADRIVILKEGEIQQIGTPFEIYNNPVSRFVADFMGSPAMNFVECVVLNNRLIVESADNKNELSVPLNDESSLSNMDTVILGIRPEMVTEPKPGSTGPFIHHFAFDVDVIEPMGADTLAIGRWNDIEVQARISPEAGMNAEKVFELQVDTSKAVLFDPYTGARVDFKPATADQTVVEEAFYTGSI